MPSKIAIAGSAVVDYYKEVDVYPEASTLSSIRNVERETGGLLCNCALGLARLDPTLSLPVIGWIGEDEAGHFIRQKLSQHKAIDLRRLKMQGQTAFTDVMVDRQNQTRTFFHYRGSNRKLDLEHFDLPSLEADILHVGYLLLLDRLDAADPEHETRMARLLHEAKRRGMQTSIDVVSEDSNRFTSVVRPALPHVDYCLINEFEAARITGIDVRDGHGTLRADKVSAAAEKLLQLGVMRWAIIHAREGALGKDPQGQQVCLSSLMLPKSKISNTTGAGDAFASGVLCAAARKQSLADAIRLGLATAAASLLQADATSGIRAAEDMHAFHQMTRKETWPHWPGDDA